MIRGTRSGVPPCRMTRRDGRQSCAFRCRNCASMPKSAQTWGINVSRFIHRKNETVWLEFWPKNDNGLASRMMHLAGLDGVRPRRRLELAPYTAVRQEFVEAGGRRPVQRRRAHVRLDWRRRQSFSPRRSRARCDDQPRFRAGRSRSGRRQSDGLRDVLPGEAAVFHRRRRDLQQLRQGGSNNFLRLQQFHSESVLLAPHRPRAVGERRWGLRRHAARNHDSRRGEVDRQNVQRLEHRHHRSGHRSRTRASCDGIANAIARWSSR